MVESKQIPRSHRRSGKAPRQRSGWRRFCDACELGSRLLVGLVLTGSIPLPALANPEGGTVTDGSATITQSGNRVDVHQASDRAVIDWRSFSIAPGEITRFHQPSAGSIALNRVTGADPSRIFGTLRANGRVFLINPNGIMFGAGSRIDVSGLVATTSDIRNEDFMAGRMEFSIPSLNPEASVVNEGQISIADAGYAALVAPHVRNSGVINARLGRVTLGAADAFAIDLYGDDLVTFRVGVGRTPLDADGKPVDSLVDNRGSILAGGGVVRLATHNVEAVVRNVINTDGVIYADTFERKGGKIILGASGAGAVQANGTLSARGGSVEIAGDEDISLTGTRIAASDVAISADADKSGAGDLNAGESGGDAVLTDIDIDTAAGGDAGGNGGGNAGGETGGSVSVTGDRVALRGGTSIDASGATGGGKILIGGNFQGSGTLRNADATTVDADVTLNAAAGETGDGGTVILWADGYTRFHGDISAIGGLTGGDGGFVEVSGKQNLDFVGHVDTTAAMGNPGTLLLDPVNILVSALNTEGASGGTILFGDPSILDPWNVSPAALDGVGGNILLQATNNITISSAVNLTTAGATFTATANNDIDVNANLTTNGGAITLTADADGSSAGDLSIAGGQTVTSGGSTINITANDVDFSGATNSGAGTTTILISDGGTILLGGGGSGDMTIAAAELQNITATSAVIGDATNGNITIKNILAANSDNIGTLTLNATKAGSTVDFSGSGGVFNALVINANTLVSAKALTTDTGGLTINGANGVTFTDNVVTAGAVVIDADSDNNGSGTFTIDATFGLTTGGNTLSVTADDIALNGTVNTGAAATTILISDGGTIGLGASAQNLTISGAELQNITATGLTIGDATNGNITVDGITAANSNNITGSVTLNATKDNASISFSGTASTFNAVIANADDGISVGVDLSTDVGGLTLEGDADNAADTNDNITFSAGATLASFGNIALDATTGKMTGAGGLTLNARTGIAVNDNLTTLGATVINADSNNNGASNFSVAAGAAISTSGNTLSVTAPDIVLTGTLNSGAALTTLIASNGGTIGLGATAGTFTLSGAELQNITATGLTIGDATNGDVTVDGITAANSNNISGTLTINATNAASSISFSNTASTFNTLTANAGNSITGNIPVTTDTGGLSFSAGAGITFNDTVTTAGATTIDADSDDSGAGTFSLNNALNTSNNTLSITADDVAISNTINTGSAAVTILASDGGAIGLGATAGGLTLSGTELQNITATGLTIGDATAGNIVVDGITAANSNNITGTVTLNAAADNSTVSFVTTASTFNALDVNADDRISVGVNISTDTGNLSLDGDVDNSADANDDVTFTAGLTLASAGSITLDATNGNMSGAGALTLNANNGVTLNDSLTTAGATVVDADDDTNGSGTFTIAASRTLSTTNNALQIIANKIALSGALNSGTQSTTLTPTNSAAVDLGSATDAAGNTVELSAAELQSITAASLTIGDATAGAITVSADVTPGSTGGTGVTTLNLVSGSTVTATAGGIVETNLSITAAGAVTFSAAATNITTLGVDTSTGNISFTDADGFTVGTVGSVTGVDTAAGSVSLTATTGNIVVSNTAAANDIGATTGIALSAAADNASIAIQAGADAEALSGAHSYTADDIEITGTITATGQTVTLASTTAGDAVDVGDPGGGGDNVADTLELAGAEIQNITAANLNIGGSSAGNMTVDGITAANSDNISGTVTLIAGGNGSSMTFQNTASTFNALTANADDRLSVNIGITTDTGNLALDGDADNAADTNDDTVIAAGITLASAGSMTIGGTTGGITGSGAVTLNADSGLTLSDGYTGSGNADFKADNDSNGVGNFVASTINVGANTLTVTGKNVNTGTSVTAGTTALDGAVTGSGLTVTALTLTGASAALTGTTVGGQTGDDAATATTMPDGASHTVNGCQKTSCVVAVDPPPPPEDLDTVQVGTGGTGGTDTGGGSGGTGGDASGGDSSGSDSSGSGTGDTGGGDTSGGDTSGTDSSGGGDTSSTGGGTGDIADGDTGGGWSDGSFNAASGDVLLTGSVGNFQVFFEALKEDGANTLELLEASENMDNPELASLVKALGDILGEYEFVSTSIPTNAFDDKATTLLPGLLTFDPAAIGGDGRTSPASRSYRPPSFGRFQF